MYTHTAARTLLYHKPVELPIHHDVVGVQHSTLVLSVVLPLAFAERCNNNLYVHKTHQMIRKLVVCMKTSNGSQDSKQVSKGKRKFAASQN